jgi:hypothetical protein
MSKTVLSKYAENQFLVATVGTYPLMSEILADTLPRAIAVTAGFPIFTTAITHLQIAANAWDAGETRVTNAAAALPGATLAFSDKMAALTRKPDVDTSSLLEIWDTTLRSQVAYRGPAYIALFPHGRRALTHGSLEKQLEALQEFGLRLTAHTSRPILVALGTAVTTFSNTARALRTAQTTAKAALENARLDQETLRVAAAAALYSLIGQGMATWGTNPAQVDTLWNVNLLRKKPVKTIPEAGP